jgi:hypothetical protein
MLASYIQKQNEILDYWIILELENFPAIGDLAPAYFNPVPCANDSVEMQFQPM